jgi:hypothetical protein
MEALELIVVRSLYLFRGSVATRKTTMQTDMSRCIRRNWICWVRHHSSPYLKLKAFRGTILPTRTSYEDVRKHDA